MYEEDIDSNQSVIQVTKNFQFLVENDDTRIVILEGSSRCFHSGQLVVTSKGSKPISEVSVGDMVLSYNEATKENEYRRVTGLHQYKNDKECIKVTLKNGTVIHCTEDHEFFYEGAWISLKHLLFSKNKK